METMASYQCPFCNADVPMMNGTCSISDARFRYENEFDDEYNFQIVFFRCPVCEKISSVAIGKGIYTNEILMYLYPASRVKRFPEYVPAHILKDYREAAAIRLLSPNASAALLRRCLQGIIHDVWDIHEKNLNAEITRLRERIPDEQWHAIDAVRKMGNIGAHMEQNVDKIIDIETDDVDPMIQLIESLIEDWYIVQRKNKKTYEDLIARGEKKDTLRREHP